MILLTRRRFVEPHRVASGDIQELWGENQVVTGPNNYIPSGWGRQQGKGEAQQKHKEEGSTHGVVLVVCVVTFE